MSVRVRVPPFSPGRSFLSSLSFRFLLSFPSSPSFLLFISFTSLLGTDTHSPAEPLQPSTDGGRLCMKSGKMASSFHFRRRLWHILVQPGPFLDGGDAGGWSLTESECVEDGRPSGEAVTARVSDERSEESARQGFHPTHSRQPRSHPGALRQGRNSRLDADNRLIIRDMIMSTPLEFYGSVCALLIDNQLIKCVSPACQVHLSRFLSASAQLVKCISLLCLSACVECGLHLISCLSESGELDKRMW